MIITKCEAVSPALEEEYKAQSETEENGVVVKKPKLETGVEREATGIVLKPKQEVVTKSAAQIVHEQHGK